MAIKQKSPKQRANQEFNEHIKQILLYYNNLNRLQDYFNHNVPPGHFLKYEQQYEDGSSFTAEVTKKDIRALYYQLRNMIKGLKILFRRKKNRNIVDLSLLLQQKPNGWVQLLKGQNRPSVASPALVKYLASEDFGTVNPPQYDVSGNLTVAPSGQKLIDKLPSLKAGYGLKAAFALLFFHAIRVADVTGSSGGHKDDSNHRLNYFTNAMLSAFGTGNTPYIYANGVKAPNPSNGKESTIDYLIAHRYQNEGTITRQFVHLTVVQTILNLNIQDIEDLSNQQVNYINNFLNVEKFVLEYLLAKEVRTEWAKGMKPKTDLRRKAMRKTPRSTR